MIQLAELSSPSDSNPSITQSTSITAVVDSAICVGAGGSSGSLADKPIVRTASGDLLIPASQLKGRLHHECEKLLRGLGWPVCHSPKPENMCPERADAGDLAAEFHRSEYQLDLDNRLMPMPIAEGDRNAPAPESPHYHCYICQIFGNPALPASVIFDDLVCENSGRDNYAETLRPGVTLNRRRRTAEDQKFFLLETSPPQTQLKFTGEIHILPNAPAFTQTLLALALNHIHALGGSKSAGLGWLHWEHNLQADVHALNRLNQVLGNG